MSVHWSPAAIRELERAIEAGTRVRMMRRGTEHVVLPLSLAAEGTREVLTGRHATTGEELAFFLDEVDELDVLR